MCETCVAGRPQGGKEGFDSEAQNAAVTSEEEFPKNCIWRGLSQSPVITPNPPRIVSALGLA